MSSDYFVTDVLDRSGERARDPVQGVTTSARSGPPARSRTTRPHASHRPAEARPQQPQQEAVSGPTQAVIRSADGASPVTMAVGRDGDLFASIGVALGPDGRRVGRIKMAGSVGSATTPTALKVGSGAGEVMFRAPEDGQELEISVTGTAQRARGHAVRVLRDRAGGPLRAEVVTP